MTLKSLITRRPLPRQKLVAGAIAGLASSAAYALVQSWDLNALDYATDDFVLLGSMAPVNDDSARPLGAVMHFGNGAALGAAYALFGHERLPGSPLVRGLTWTMLETFALYPLALFEHLHPAVRDGRLPSYLTGKAFAQQLLRHVGYGIVLGPMTERLLTRK